MILRELQQVMPSFVSRVERPDRGGEWIAYLRAAPRARPRAGSRGSASTGATPASDAPSVELVHVDGTEEDLLASCLFEAAARARRPRSCARIDVLDRDERAELLAAMVGERAQPPPPPRPRLRGAALPLRDRLRLRRLPRPAAPPDADLPVAAARPRPRRRRARTRSREAGVGGEFERALEISRDEYERLVDGRAAPSRRPTRSASPTGSATRSTSTPARRCT